LGKKKKKFDELEVNENYIPENESQKDEPAEKEPDDFPETAKKADKYAVKKSRQKPVVKSRRRKSIRPEGKIPAHFLMLITVALSVLGRLISQSGFFDSFKGNTVYIAYTVMSLVIFVLPAVIYCAARRRTPKKTYLRTFSPEVFPLIFISLALLVSLVALEQYSVAYIFSYRVTQAVPYNASVAGTVLVSALLPAICEETLLRGVLQAEYSRYGGGMTGIFACAVIFAILHFDLPFFFIYFTAGLVLGVVTHVTHSVIPAMLLHFANNLFALFLADSMTFLANERIGGAFLMILLTIACFVFLLIQLQMTERLSRKRAARLAVKQDDGDKDTEESVSAFAEQVTGENSPEIRFFPPEGAFAQRFFRLMFSPFMILAFIVFAVVVR